MPQGGLEPAAQSRAVLTVKGGGTNGEKPGSRTRVRWNRPQKGTSLPCSQNKDPREAPASGGLPWLKAMCMEDVRKRDHMGVIN